MTGGGERGPTVEKRSLGVGWLMVLESIIPIFFSKFNSCESVRVIQVRRDEKKMDECFGIYI